MPSLLDSMATLAVNAPAVPAGHTPFSWGVQKSEGSTPHVVARGSSPSWPPAAGSVLPCVVVLAAGSVDWSGPGDAAAQAGHGPHRFSNRVLYALEDRPPAGVSLLGPREQAKVGGESAGLPQRAAWRLHVVAAGHGRLRVRLQSASSRCFLCSDGAGVLRTGAEDRPDALWDLPVQALRPVCGLPCRVRSVEHARYLSLCYTGESACADAAAAAGGQGRMALRTTGDRKKACELLVHGLLAAPPELWGWDALTKQHGPLGPDADAARTHGDEEALPCDAGGQRGAGGLLLGVRTKANNVDVGAAKADGADSSEKWIMMIRHGLSVANVQKDVFKGVCDERFVDAPLSPQGRF